ncbi:MAG: T9SS type A sorting domain-containing protein [Bacteroidetes bacterium]|nr:T9SS type A sorting domain-containing protein [Bacteroidota bacterium]
MKNVTLFLLLLCFPWVGSHPQTIKKVLFIGNSYTFVNALPGLTAQIASSKGDSLYHEQSTPGGYTFLLHSQNQATRAAINSLAWDVVVLQEQSQLPALDPDSVAVTTYPYADTLNRLIKENNSSTTTLFYMTWGRKYGDTDYCPVYPPVCTYEGMQARLTESYDEMGQMFTAAVAPVGVAWETVRESNPNIELYISDNSHPSLNGSYLAACVFYAEIFNKSPVGGFVPAGMSQETADTLQIIAYNTVFSCLGVPDVLSHDLRIYPNPAKRLVNIGIPGERPGTTALLKVYSTDGNLIRQASIGAPFTLDVSGLKDGLYNIIFRYRGQQFTSRLLIIR